MSEYPGPEQPASVGGFVKNPALQFISKLGIQTLLKIGKLK